jgi:putative intracellular protease/amidase
MDPGAPVGYRGGMSSRIALVVTTHAQLGDTGRATGYYLGEVAEPYVAFADAGYQVDLVSVPGGPAPADPKSLKAAEQAGSPSARFAADPDAQAQVAATLPVADLDPGDFDAVFVAGGHGAMWDLPGSDDLARFVAGLFDAGKVVAAVCHGPGGLVDARREDGESILAGRQVTGFTNEEEQAVGLADVVPFLLEDRMRELGGAFEAGPRWSDHAIRDGNLVTGQNPRSSGSTAALVLDALAAATRR